MKFKPGPGTIIKIIYTLFFIILIPYLQYLVHWEIISAAVSYNIAVWMFVTGILLYLDTVIIGFFSRVKSLKGNIKPLVEYYEKKYQNSSSKKKKCYKEELFKLYIQAGRYQEAGKLLNRKILKQKPQYSLDQNDPEKLAYIAYLENYAHNWDNLLYLLQILENFLQQKIRNKSLRLLLHNTVYALYTDYYLAHSRLQQAFSTISKGLKQFTTPFLLHKAGIVYYYRHLLDDALNYLHQSIARSPKYNIDTFIPAYYYLFKIYGELGKLFKAKYYFDQMKKYFTKYDQFNKYKKLINNGEKLLTFFFSKNS
ncbi:MAG TPA: hypothetical protein VKS21_05415 [Spirochaetota bacterium]|nr:hypothetical protein [Spirochaetota bacterium]